MTLSVPVNGPAKRKLISGLDTLRLFAALAVVTSHLASNMPIRPESQIGSWAWHMLGYAANGRIAVAFFFVLSGFCIHLGQAGDPRIDVRHFLVRRAIRIGMPLIAVKLLALWLSATAVVALDSVLWTVYCELIYYAVYPGLLALRRRVSMGRIFGYGTVVAVAVWLIGAHLFSAEFYDIPNVPAYCHSLYPLWLLGALLAERHGAQVAPVTFQSIACWRAGAVMLCFVAGHIQANAWQLGSWLLYPAVGLYCWSYVPKELARWAVVRPPSFTERLGAASYSLYLVHILPIAVAIDLNPGWPFPSLLSAQIAAITIVTAFFCLACERPCHRLARSASRRPSLERATFETAAL